MLNCFDNAVFVFDADVSDQFAGRIGVTKNQGYPCCSEFGSHTPLHRTGNNRNATSITLPQLSHDRLGPLRVIFGVAEQHVKAAIPCHCLITPDNLRKVRVGNLGNDQPQ